MDANEILINQVREIKMERIRKLKQMAWRKDPMLWLEERFGEDRRSFQWSGISELYKDHDWDGDKDPLYQAWMDLATKEAPNNWVALKAATGTGKTFFLARLICWFLDCYENSLVVTTAPAETQLKINLWGEISRVQDKFKKIRPYTRITSLSLKPEGDNPSEFVPHRNSYLATGLVSGVKSGEESATKMQGFHRDNMLIICEEAAGMHPAVMTAIQNTCTASNNLIIAVGNPDSENDELHQFSILGNVNSYRVSALDYPNVVMNTEIFSGAVSNASIQRRKEKYSEDSPLYQSRVRGMTPSGSADTLIRRDWIRRICVERVPEEKLDDSYHAIGVDVANSENGDKASLAYGKRNVLTEVYEFQCPNASHLAYNLFMSEVELSANGYNAYNVPTMQDNEVLSQCIGVDAVGLGVSTINTLENNNIICTGLQGGDWAEIIPIDNEGKPLYAFRSLRDQMYWELREDIRMENIFITIQDPNMLDQIVGELSTPKFILSDSKIAVEGKNMIKKRMGGKSPNVADAVAYWNWVRKGYRISGGFAAMTGGA